MFYMVPYAGNTSGSDRHLCVQVVVSIDSYSFYMVPYAGNARASMRDLCVVVVDVSIPVCVTWRPMLVPLGLRWVTSAW